MTNKVPPKFEGRLFDLSKVAGMAGLKPAKCESQSLVPYRLGYIPIKLRFFIYTHTRVDNRKPNEVWIVEQFC